MQRYTNRVTVRLTDDELQRMKFKMNELEISSMSAYMRKMILDGYCVKIDTKDLNELVYLLRMCSNNLNQYAKKANGLGVVYQQDIKELQKRLDEIWNGTRDIMQKFAAID
ncbi:MULTISPECIES: plasmid mobilization protein [Pseudobutyrivibrio]|uniref:Mobilisation protein (MobC) n=1 Tax=Pseudobutyrivibrio xylanivorans DSM 14809 TaxID=1123012 RepID=A0A1M6KXU9_PSEXY|nr:MULTISPECIES: plasmid mobilization relaxosome protein MobC [Pseudobutyrivibrio]SEA60811.1 mobilisation protein (MobC) [Pseudobutyrivibrio sp. ACV-2]SFH58388.1 mobilisation protein (MobC) [Pseudobutyrivibrio sp. OR37]SHJ63702.1 mobilisation protein (MobC) [Pseudobutyrivibrio xylanivorans DSM 14809]